jgi:hypothetical protein
MLHSHIDVFLLSLTTSPTGEKPEVAIKQGHPGNWWKLINTTIGADCVDAMNQPTTTQCFDRSPKILQLFESLVGHGSNDFPDAAGSVSLSDSNQSSGR